MSYINDKILSYIRSFEPTSIDGEAIVLINGFDDLRIYHEIALSIFDMYNSTQLKVEIKLAEKKWNKLKKCGDTSIINSMVNRKFIAENSVTYYRNLHQFNMLILLGTEDEDDTGGLKNCFTINPESLLRNLNGEYCSIFSDCFDHELNKDDNEIINVMYKRLFEFFSPDICRLSEHAKEWHQRFSSISDFISSFCLKLPEWGLPPRINLFPNSKQILQTTNFLSESYHFITRKLFSSMSVSKYKKISDQLKEYEDEHKRYSSIWSGWNKTDFRTFDNFSKALLEFAVGTNIEKNLKLFLKLDYSIIEDILKIKLPKTSRAVVAKEKIIYGDPLRVFTTVYLTVLTDAKSLSLQNISKVQINFTQAEIVTGYTDLADSEQINVLSTYWKNICLHVNGVVPFINSTDWNCNDDNIVYSCSNDSFFSLSEIYNNINNQFVRTVAGTNTLNKIFFTVSCVDDNGELVFSSDNHEIENDYCWKFSNDDGWLHDFRCFLADSLHASLGKPYIPVLVFNKIKNAVFSKSVDEFFDVFEESDLDYSFNLIEFLRQKIAGTDFFILFQALAEKFITFVREILNFGFYSCLRNPIESSISNYINAYNTLAEYILSHNLNEDQLLVLDSFIYSFSIVENTSFLECEEAPDSCIVPPWHPAALQKLCDQKRFVIDCLKDAWIQSQEYSKKFNCSNVINELHSMADVRSAVDLLPFKKVYLTYIGSFGSYSLFRNLLNTSCYNVRLKDLIRKEAIYDDQFSRSDLIYMSDDARLILDVLKDYVKTMPSSMYNLCLSFVNPKNLQPIISSIYHLIDYLRNCFEDYISIKLYILVKPENRGGRNYLTYWMDDYFAQNDQVSIKTYLNEWTNPDDLEKLLCSNNDIVFNMDLLRVENYSFSRCSDSGGYKASDCRFPIVFKPSPLSVTSSNKRKIEMSQPQFSASYNHTQVVYYRNCISFLGIRPQFRCVAVKELSLSEDAIKVIDTLHKNSYWVVCVDPVIDGALLKKGCKNCTVIGFSTGKGTYGQYNLTITVKNSILKSVEHLLSIRLRHLFNVDSSQAESITNRIIEESGSLDGISLFSAINPYDNSINEFMAYVLVSMREKLKDSQAPLKIIVHLDSYKHWFDNNNESSSRPDFLMLSVDLCGESLKIEATVIECKISRIRHSDTHKEKAIEQVRHGMDQLKKLFSPSSDSKERRYWFSQLYRALVFAQISFSNNSDEFETLSKNLRAILNGRFEINWKGEVLGFWVDLAGSDETTENVDDLMIVNIPQQRIYEILSKDKSAVFNSIADDDSILFEVDEEDDDNSNDKLKEKEEEEQKQITEMYYHRIKTRESSNEIDSDTRIQSPTFSEPVPPNNLLNNEQNISSESSITSSTLSNTEIMDAEQNISVTACNSVRFKDSTHLSESRILIGPSKSGSNVFWEFGNPQLSNRHLLITGTSGQGKTYCIQTLLYEVSKFGFSSVVFDYTEGFKKGQIEEAFSEKMNDKINQKLIYTEGVPINPFKRNSIDIDGEFVIEKISDIAMRIASIFAHVYKFGDQQKSAIYNVCLTGLEKFGDSMNMIHFSELLKETDNKYAKSVYSKLLPFLTGITFKDTGIDWEEIIYGNEGKLTIFQLTRIVRDAQVAITEFLLWDLLYFTMNHGNKDHPFVVVLDEAQNLSHKDNSPSEKILTEGRKFGWSAWYATQSLENVANEEVFRLMQSAFKLCFKPTDREVNKLAKELCPSNPNEYREILSNLNKGQCLVVGSRIQNNGTFGPGRPTVVNVSSFDKRQ